MIFISNTKFGMPSSLRGFRRKLLLAVAALCSLAAGTSKGAGTAVPTECDFQKIKGLEEIYRKLSGQCEEKCDREDFYEKQGKIKQILDEKRSREKETRNLQSDKVVNLGNANITRRRRLNELTNYRQIARLLREERK